jgi:Mg-chelatase subunit ChlD
MDAHFILISDGGADHPKNQLAELKRIKQALEANSHKLFMTTMYIGSGESKNLKDIANELGGSSEFVSNASEISVKFTEIMIKAK